MSGQDFKTSHTSGDQARQNADHAVANLQRAFHAQGISFDWADAEAVAANKRGEITPAQRQMLESAKSGRSLAGCLFVMLNLVITLPAIVGGFITHQSSLVGSGGVILFVFGFIWAMTAQAARRIDHEVKTNVIAQAPGEIVWQNDAYIPITNGRKLRFASKRYGYPFPGPHEFYYLPMTRYLLAATPASLAPQPALDRELASTMSRGEPSRLALLQAVTTANGFPSRVLDKNREGRMATGQRWRLFRSLQGAGLALIVQLAVALALIMLPFIAGSRLADGSTVARVGLVAVGLGILGYTLLHNVWVVSGQLADLITGQLVVREGSVDRDLQLPQGESDPTTYYYEADGKRFKVTKKGYDAIIPGLRYRVFYTPNSKILMNIEPIDI